MFNNDQNKFCQVLTFIDEKICLMSILPNFFSFDNFRIKYGLRIEGFLQIMVAAFYNTVPKMNEYNMDMLENTDTP